MSKTEWNATDEWMNKRINEIKNKNPKNIDEIFSRLLLEKAIFTCSQHTTSTQCCKLSSKNFVHTEPYLCTALLRCFVLTLHLWTNKPNQLTKRKDKRQKKKKKTFYPNKKKNFCWSLEPTFSQCRNERKITNWKWNRNGSPKMKRHQNENWFVFFLLFLFFDSVQAVHSFPRKRKFVSI